MIEFYNVTKQFLVGKSILKAVNNVSFKIEEGAIFGIIGKSGAGKSTVLRMINQLEAQDEGVVIVDGLDIKNLAEDELRNFRMQCPMVFQHFNLLWSRTVFENVMLPLELSGSDIDARDRVLEILELVGLLGKADEYPSKLSGGQKQRVGIARALILNPKIILCDEATSALDPETTLSILHLLKSINKKLGITIVLITHEMEVVESICDKTMEMEDGVIKSIGNTLDIMKSQIAAKKSSVQEKIIRLTFKEGSTLEHTFYELVTRFGLKPNIVSTSIKLVNSRAVGFLIMRIDRDFCLNEVKKFLASRSIEIEVVL